MNFSERVNARRARKAYDVVGSKRVSRHFRNGGIARVLHHGDATVLLECRQAGSGCYSVLNICILC